MTALSYAHDASVEVGMLFWNVPCLWGIQLASRVSLKSSHNLCLMLTLAASLTAFCFPSVCTDSTSHDWRASLHDRSKTELTEEQRPEL